MGIEQCLLSTPDISPAEAHSPPWESWPASGHFSSDSDFLPFPWPRRTLLWLLWFWSLCSSWPCWLAWPSLYLALPILNWLWTSMEEPCLVQDRVCARLCNSLFWFLKRNRGSSWNSCHVHTMVTFVSLWGKILDSWGFGAVLSLSVHNQCAVWACTREISSPPSCKEVVNPPCCWCSSQA